jgi:hypothetical protein
MNSKEAMFEAWWESLASRWEHPDARVAAWQAWRASAPQSLKPLVLTQLHDSVREQFALKQDENGHEVACIPPQVWSLLKRRVLDLDANWHRYTEQKPVRYWRDMESAPKDGTAIFAMLPDSTVPQSVRWSESDECWIVCWDHHKLVDLNVPQFWMPIP